MKRLLFVFVAVLALQACSARVTDGDYQKRAKQSEECVAETGVDTDLFAKFDPRSDQADDRDSQSAENDKMKRYVVCFYTKMGAIDASGAVQKEAFKKALIMDRVDATKVDAIVDKCAVQKDVVWETVNGMRKCVENEFKS